MSRRTLWIGLVLLAFLTVFNLLVTGPMLRAGKNDAGAGTASTAPSSQPPSAEPDSHRIKVRSGGDPFYNESTNMAHGSYLSKAEPGHHSDDICFIRVGGEHRVEISALLWSILAMESDATLFFSSDQVTRLLPLVTRTLDGYNRARHLEERLTYLLDEKQMAFVHTFLQTSRAERERMESRARWSPAGRCPPRQDFFLWRGQELLKTILDPAARIAPDDALLKRPAPDPSQVVAIPDFYWALVMMIRLHPELKPTPTQAWQLYNVTRELAVAILDYESLTGDYSTVYRPEQKRFLLGLVPMLNHVFPP